MRAIQFILSFLIFLLSFMKTAVAQQSGFALRPAVMYYSTVTEDGGKSGQTNQLIDITLGYINDSGIFFGGTYHTPTITLHSTNSDTKINRTSYGISVGYIGDGPYILGTYYLSAKEDVSGTVYTGGTHYQVDFGYRFRMGSIDIAPQLTWFNFEFTSREVGGTTTSLATARRHYGLAPMVALWIMF